MSKYVSECNSRCYVENKLALYDGLQTWPPLRSIIMVEAIGDSDGVQTKQTRFYLSHLKLSAQAFNRHVRQHWRIENQLHWNPDIVFPEDKQQRVRLGNAAQNFATVRKLAGWDKQYLLTI